MNMYVLEVLEKNFSIKLKMIKENNYMYNTYLALFNGNYGGIRKHNDVYTVSFERKKLKELGNEIKSDWLYEVENVLNTIKKIKI